MKKIISIILVLILTTTIAYAAPLFTDVSDEAWYKDSVQYVFDKEIMVGYGDKFRPDDYVTRAELATVVQRISDSEQKTIDTVVKTLPYCVGILSGASRGSGVIIEKNLVLTANHVLKADEAIIKFQNNAVTGKVTYRSVTDDLAIVELYFDTTLEPLIISDVVLGETIIAIGNPYGYEFSVTKGIVSYVDRPIDDNLYIQFDAAVNPGNSGCPLFNLNGELVGIIVSKITDAEGMNFAVPWHKVKEFIEGLI